VQWTIAKTRVRETTAGTHKKNKNQFAKFNNSHRLRGGEAGESDYSKLKKPVHRDLRAADKRREGIESLFISLLTSSGLGENRQRQQRAQGETCEEIFNFYSPPSLAFLAAAAAAAVMKPRQLIIFFSYILSSRARLYFNTLAEHSNHFNKSV
jgi:hypothetical protein